MVSTELSFCFRAMHIYKHNLTSMLTRLETFPAQIQTLLGDISEQKNVDLRKFEGFWSRSVGDISEQKVVDLRKC